MLAARQEWRASFILLGSRPYIEARRSLTVEDGAERLLDVVGGIDAVQLAGRHEGGEHGPVFSAHIVAREERILSCEGNWSDEILDGVGIQFKAPVFKEAGETSPEPERIGDVGG